jgi:hypothetical protein
MSYHHTVPFQKESQCVNTLAETKTCFLKDILYVSRVSYLCHRILKVLKKIQYYIFKIKTISKDIPAIHVDIFPQ